MIYRNEVSKQLQLEKQRKRKQDRKDTIIGGLIFVGIAVLLLGIANIVY